MKKLLALLMAATMAVSLAACGGGGSSTVDNNTDSTPATTDAGNDGSSSEAGDDNNSTASGDGAVYFFNFKPESDEVYQEIAQAYTDETGVPVKVVTAASGTYEQQLRSEITKSDAPTIFQINGPVGLANWKDYCLDLKDTDLYGKLNDQSLAVESDGGVYGIPFAIEGYGIIVNKAIMEKYFDMDGAKISSLDDLKDFDTLKEVVEDMQDKKDDLGIDGVFASTSLATGEDWRWQTHLSNIALYYEWKDDNADLSDPDAIAEIDFKYNENYKNIFDLYLNNSTVAPTLTGSKSVDDSMAEFALGQAAMVQNGNWAYSQISGVSGNTVNEEDVVFVPIYIGVDDDKEGLAIGTENFFCINSQASEENQQASIDFMTWLYTSDTGMKYVTDELGFIAPFDSFGDDMQPSDPLGKQVAEWSNNDDVDAIAWDFTVYPSQTFKDNFGGYLLQYAQGNMDWNDLVDNVKTDWANEMQATSSNS